MRSLTFIVFLLVFPQIFNAQDTNVKISPIVTYSSRAYIEVRNSSTRKGSLTFFFTPKGGARQEINIEIKKGLKTKKIAKKIESILENKLPNAYSSALRSRGGSYYIDIEKNTSTAADFDLSHKITVQGLSISIVK